MIRNPPLRKVLNYRLFRVYVRLQEMARATAKSLADREEDKHGGRIPRV